MEKPQNRLIVSLPQILRRVVRIASKHRECSQAEVIRTALYEHLRDFIEEDNKEGMKSD